MKIIDTKSGNRLDAEGKAIALDLCAFLNGVFNFNFERLVYINTLFACTWDRLKREGKIPKDLYLIQGFLWSMDSNTKDGMGWDRPHNQISSHPQKPRIK